MSKQLKLFFEENHTDNGFGSEVFVVGSNQIQLQIGLIILPDKTFSLIGYSVFDLNNKLIKYCVNCFQRICPTKNSYLQLEFRKNQKDF